MQIVHHRNPYSALLGRGSVSYRGCHQEKIINNNLQRNM